MKNIIGKYINVEKPRTMLTESTWCGVPDTIYRYHGAWATPEVEYKGKLYDEWDLQEYIGEIFNDYCAENNIEVPPLYWAEEFSNWLEKNPEYAYSAFSELEPNEVITEDNITEPDDSIQVYMNTWKNYNEYGADLEAYGIKDGWMSIDDAIEFCKKYAEDEPFINDVDNCPIEVSEYDNAPAKLEELKKIEDATVDKDILTAFLEEDRYSDIDEIIDKIESGDFIFFPGVDNDSDLAQAYIDMCGGVTEAVSKDRLRDFFDENSYREEIEDDIRNYIAQENGYDSIDDVSDEELDSWLDDIVEEDIANAQANNNDDFFESHFDYDAFGRDLSFDYTYTSTGALSSF